MATTTENASVIRPPAPDLPECRFPSWKVVGKVLAFLVLSVSWVYRWGRLNRIIPQPWRSILGLVVLAAIVSTLVLVPKLATSRRVRHDV
ncbi:hypothetical protein [Aquisphaera insulae]|uniref:hypothetical protein n=1 Tax=Aquisphaera insulae TaxID=2712864 RepID=UPI0013EB55AF|nr:hypothetical protein [Aquisphaera insulae]